FEETKTAGAQLIKLKGGSGFAVGLSIREVVEALALDRRCVLPVSTLQQGLYGVRDVCLSVPTVVGCGGVRQQIELALTPKERMGLQNSAKVLRETIEAVDTRLLTGPVKMTTPVRTTPIGAIVATGSGVNERTVPRKAWSAAKK